MTSGYFSNACPFVLTDPGRLRTQKNVLREKNGTKVPAHGTALTLTTSRVCATLFQISACWFKSTDSRVTKSRFSTAVRALTGQSRQQNF